VYAVTFIYTYLKAGKLMEFAFLWNVSPCCLAADVSNESTVSVICVDDQGTVTVVAAGSVPHYTPSPTFLVTTTVDIYYRGDVHAMGQGVSRRPLIAEARVRLQTGLCDSYGRHGRVLRFSPVLPIPYTHIRR
jgi:hypothetical protein